VNSKQRETNGVWVKAAVSGVDTLRDDPNNGCGGDYDGGGGDYAALVFCETFYCFLSPDRSISVHNQEKAETTYLMKALYLFLPLVK